MKNGMLYVEKTVKIEASQSICLFIHSGNCKTKQLTYNSLREEYKTGNCTGDQVLHGPLRKVTIYFMVLTFTYFMMPLPRQNADTIAGQHSSRLYYLQKMWQRPNSHHLSSGGRGKTTRTTTRKQKGPEAFILLLKERTHGDHTRYTEPTLCAAVLSQPTHHLVKPRLACERSDVCGVVKPAHNFDGTLASHEGDNHKLVATRRGFLKCGEVHHASASGTVPNSEHHDVELRSSGGGVVAIPCDGIA